MAIFEDDKSIGDYALPAAAGLGAMGLGAAALIRRNPWLRTGAKYHLANDFGIGSWTPPKRTLADEAARGERWQQAQDQVRQLAAHIREQGLDPSQMRIGVTGISGSGKGALSGILADELGMKHVELDPVVFGRAQLDDIWQGRPPEEWTSRLMDKLKFWGKPTPNRIEEIFAEQGMPRGGIYDYVNPLGLSDPERYDAIIRVDRPLDEIKQDLLHRGYGAFSPELFDVEGVRGLTKELFERSGGEAVNFGQASLKLRPEGGWRTGENIAQALRERGDTGFGRKSLHAQASQLYDPNRKVQPGWMDNLKWKDIGKGTAAVGGLGAAAAGGTYAAQERLKQSAFIGDDDASTNLALGGGAASLAGAGGLEAFRRALPDVTPEGTRRLNAFLGLDPEDAANNPRAFIQDYAEAGHDAIANPITSNQTGRTLIEDLRTGRTAKGLNALGFNAAWTPNSAEHYDAFLNSPEEAVRQLVRESEHPGARYLTKVKGVEQLPGDVAQVVAEETADKVRRYQKFLPKVQALVESRPIMRRGAMGLGAAGALGLGAGLYDKLSD